MIQIPPQNLDYEKSILSACMQFSDDKDVALDILIYEDFYRKSHQVIFKAIKYLTRQQEPVDILTIKNCITIHDSLEKIGGSVALAELLNEPIPSNTEYYCRQVKALAVARKLISVCNDISKDCFEPKDSYEAILDNAQSKILSIELGGKDNFITLEDLSIESLSRYEAVKNGDVKPGIRTGLGGRNLLL